MTCLVMIIVLLVASVQLGHAAWLQYDTATLAVKAVFDVKGDSRPKAGTALFEVPGTVATLVYPAPPTCPTGQMDWTLLSNGPSLPLVVNHALTFYRCHVVSNWEELKDIRDLLIDQELEKHDMVNRMARLEAIESKVCKPGDNSDPCKGLRTVMEKRRGKYPNPTQLNRSVMRIDALYEDAEKVKDAMGWTPALRLNMDSETPVP